MYYIAKVDGAFRAAIDTAGKPNKYGRKKIFESKQDAEKWIENQSYPGMSFRYEIVTEMEDRV